MNFSLKISNPKFLKAPRGWPLFAFHFQNFQNPWHSKHLNGSFVQSDEHGVTNLSESKELEGLLWFWRQLVDTSDSDDEGELGLSWDVNVSVLFGLSGSGDIKLFFGGVFLGVGSSSLLESLSIRARREWMVTLIKARRLRVLAFLAFC